MPDQPFGADAPPRPDSATLARMRDRRRAVGSRALSGLGVVVLAILLALVPEPSAEPVAPVGAGVATETAAASEPPAADTPGPLMAGMATPTEPQRPVRPAPPRPAPAENPLLAKQISELLVEVAGRDVAVAVTVGDGGEVFSAGADKPVLPASTQKLITAAAALELMGPDHRYITEVTGRRPDEWGTVHGNLTLVGAGDPTLGTRHYGHLIPHRPRTPLELLVEDVVASGVHRVTGTVVADASAWAHEPAPAGWPTRYLSGGETSYSSALTIDAGRQIVRGGSTPVADPAAHAAAVFAGMLAERGVIIDAVATDSPPTPVRLGAVASKPMSELLAYMVQTSDNHLADGIFRSVGAVAGDGTWSGSATAATDVLWSLGVDVTDLVIDDGSGLSRANQVPVSVLVGLDAAMTDKHDAWPGLHAVSGRSGTLRNRLRGTSAEGMVRAKTGTLRDVRALAGSVQSPHGGRYHFAVIGNDLDDAGVQAIRRLQDQVAVALNQSLSMCAAPQHAAERACKN